MILGEPVMRLAERAGILLSYRDAWGAERRISKATAVALLDAMQVPAASPAEIESSLRQFEEAPWRRALPPVLATRNGAGHRPAIPITLDSEQRDTAIEWTFVPERGPVHVDRLRFTDLPLAACTEIAGARIERRIFTLPFAVDLGYHHFHLQRSEPAETCLPLIVAPERCYQPPARSGEKFWGVVSQLYSLRSRRNWGMGDFTDLRRLVEIGARHGADLIGFNPLHAAFPDWPHHCSPYSPSHRQFLGALYLDIEAMEDFVECPEARSQAGQPAFREELERLRSTAFVEHAAVAAVKRPIFELLYRWFRERHLMPDAGVMTKRGEQFRKFLREEGEALAQLGVFQALSEHFHGVRWQDWPAEFRDPRSLAVADFAHTHASRVEFFQYLQWQAELQLAEAVAAANRTGMPLGLYHDLAVAPAREGAETWAHQTIMARGVTLGAPPDHWNLLGQNWGLAPYAPNRLREAAYWPLAALLRENMRLGGALRVDHALGLERMFWIPEGGKPVDGGYVRYPTEELFAILALESVRENCLIVGEDLGTLPENFQERLRSAGMLSYRLLYFAQEESGAFRSPSSYPAPATVAVSTHDLATLAGYWQDRDLELRAALHLFPSESMKSEAFRRRAEDRRALIMALKGEGLLAADFPADDAAMTFDLVVAVHRFLARTPCCVMLTQLEDILGDECQANLPGTVDEHPNWRRKALSTLEGLDSDQRMKALAKAIRAERGRAGTFVADKSRDT